MKNQSTTKLLVLALGLALAGTPQSGLSATYTKDNNTDNLNLDSSWSGTGVPGATDIALWNSTITGANSTVLGANLSWLGIQIANPSGAVTIGAGSTLTIGTGGIDMSAATQNLSIGAGLTLGLGNQTWNVATGQTFTLTGALTRSGTGATLLIDKSTNTGTVTASPTLTNAIIGPWAIVKSSGTAANNSANGYTWATVSGGNIVSYTGATAVTTGFPATNGTANYDWSSIGTLSQIGSSRSYNTIRFTGTAAVTQATNSTQTETINGLMNAGGGTVTLGGGSTMNIQSGSGELVLAAMTSGIVINGPIINNGATPGAVTIVGAGSNTVTLNGANTYTGGTYISNGATVTFGSQTFSTAISGGGNILNIGATVIFTGTHSGFTGTLTQNGANNTQFNSSAAGSQNAAYILTAGDFIFALNGDYTVKMGSLSSAAGQNVRGGNSATGTTTVEVGNLNTNTSLLGGFNNGTTKVLALTKVGTGTLTLAGTNTYTGATTISAGTLQIGNGGTTGSLNAASAITNNAAIVYNRSDSLTAGNAMSGTGSLTKQGAGTLTLTGTNSYSGATTVTSGTLAFSTTAQSLGSSAFTVADGAGLSVKAASAGATLLTTGSLTLGSAGSTNLTFDFSSLNTTAALISAGAFTANGTVSVSLLNGALLASGTHALLDYTSFSGSAPTGSFSLTPRSNGTLVNDLSNTVLNLEVTSDSPKWTGLDSGSWVVGTTGSSGNWKLITSGSATDYIEGDVVLFDDTAAGTTSVTIATNVSPVSTTFNNSTQNYTVSGAAGIAAGSLAKSGTGALTISSSNSYSGGTTINGGQVNLNSPGALGTGGLTINGGTLDNTSGTSVALTTNNAQTWNSDVTFVGSNNLTTGTGIVTAVGSRTATVTSGTLGIGRISGNANFTKDGAGTLAITATAASSVSGTLAVNNGVLQMNTGTSAGTTNDFTATGLAGSGTIANGGGSERWLIITNADANTFAGSLVNGGAGALGFSKQGAGTMTLTGSNSYTGTTTVGLGTLVINGPNSGAGTIVTLNANTLVLGSASALGAASTIGLTNGATIRYATDGGDTAYATNFGTGTTLNVVLDRATAGAGVDHAMGAATWGGGTVNFTSGTNVTSGTASVAISSLGLTAGSAQTTLLNPTSATVSIGSVSIPTNNQNKTVGLGGTTTGNTVTGGITDGVAVGANHMNVAKSDTSTWTLSGNSTYTGTTGVLGGTLNVTGTLASTSSVSVSAGATLNVTGAINSAATTTVAGLLKGTGSLGAVSVTTGTAAPGNSAGTLNTGAFTLASTAILAFELNSADTSVGGGINDLISVTGALTLDGTLNITEVGGSLAYNSTYRLFNYSGALTDNTLEIDAAFLAQDGHTMSYITAAGGEVNLVVVPEPATFAMLLGGLGMLVLHRRRRQS